MTNILQPHISKFSSGQRKNLVFLQILNVLSYFIIRITPIGHWHSLHLKVSQGGARGARTNFFQLDCQKLDRLI